MALGENFGAFGSRLRFEADGFIYSGHRYMYADVRHMDFKQHTFVRKETEDGSGEQRVYEAYLRVTMASGKRLSLRPEGGYAKLVKSTDPNVQGSMQAAADWMGAYTFNARMDGYEAEFKAHKYVTWGHYQINARGDLFYRNAFCLNLGDKDVRLMLYPNHLACLRHSPRWWKRLLGALLRRSEVIDLRQDRDCFLYFMKRRLNIFWSTEKLRIYRGIPAEGPAAPKAEPPKMEPPKPGANPETPRQEAPPPPPPPKPIATHVQYLATLGLLPDVDWATVRSRYRALARENHPDLLRGKGASAATMKQAEERLKTVNEAYGWLEDFYKLKPR